VPVCFGANESALIAFSVELRKESGKRQKIEDKLVYNMQHIAKNVKERKRAYCMRSDSYIPPSVIPAEAGIQRACKYLKALDSHSPIRLRTGFMGMTKRN